MSSSPSFVRVDPDSGRFRLAGRPYCFVGANFWYGQALGSPGSTGNRARLARELDRLAELGAKNLRVMAGSEGPDTEPWRMRPALQPAPGQYDPGQLEGLDWLLSEMARRDMKAVVCLSNFWQWSGGFAAYLSWARGGEAPPYPGHSQSPDAWARYQDYASEFYDSAEARALYLDHVRAMVTRESAITGLAYRDDPTIMAWQLANEPRGGQRADAYLDWARQSAQLIKSLDDRHLVSLGSEGETPWDDAHTRFREVHEIPEIDYATFHVWVQNWQWFEPTSGVAGMRKAFDENVRAYVAEHVRIARELNVPLVLEEFGISRDDGAHGPAAPTTIRDEYYERVFSLVAEQAAVGGALSGANFWAWSGEGRPRAPGEDWKAGDAYVGDPPHEPQGWYGVYDSDDSTLEIVRGSAERLARLG